MTFSPVGRQAAGHRRPDNVVKLPKETAVIRELRKLQKFLDHEQMRERLQHKTEMASSNSRPDLHGRMGSRTSPETRTVNRLFHKLGLGRRNPVTESHLLDKPRASAAQSSAKGRPQSGHGPTAAAYRLSETHPRRTSMLDGTGAPSLAGIKSKLTPGSVTLFEFLHSARIFERLWSIYNFLVGREQIAGSQATNATLTARLTYALDGELKTGLRILIFGLGVVGVWATVIPLSGAVVVPGTLVVKSEVKKIQHPAGGVVANILVHNGMHVRAGDLLLHLDETQLRANAQVLAQQLDQTRVRLARLVAERDGWDQPRMPHELANRLDDNDIDRLWASEVSLFSSRAAARRNAKELLRSHVGQLEEQISGLDAQVKSKAAQHELIYGELHGVDGLYQKGLVPLTRKTSLQREAARLEGERGQVVAAIAETKSKISEAELQASKIDQDFRTEVMKDMREAQDKVAELAEKSIAARDLLKRVDLRAPTNGIVHQLSVHTIGGVINAGEVVMEIVPESDELQIEAKLPPQEIDQVRRGQRAYARFSAFNQRTTPQLEGIVSYVSADLTRDRQANAAYYTVRVTLPPEERRRAGDLQLVSGMPVEVFLQTGSRTMISYLFKPITDQLLRMFN